MHTPHDRRAFLQAAGLAGLGIPLGARSEAFQTMLAMSATDTAGGAKDEPEFDEEVFRFWTSEFLKPVKSPRALPRHRGPSGEVQVRSRSWKDNPLLSAEPVFFYYDRDQGWVEWDLMEDTILPERGDREVALRVSRLRPSEPDKETFNRMQSSSLRVDLQQGEPLPQLGEELVWTIVSTILGDSSGQMPQPEDLSFDPGKIWGEAHKRIPLVGGHGSWSWNFFFKKREGFWAGLMKNMLKIFQGPGQILNWMSLPAMALTAWKPLNGLMGHIFANGGMQKLLESRPYKIIATQEAFQKQGDGWPLRQGKYVVVPETQVKNFDVLGNTEYTIDRSGLIYERSLRDSKDRRESALHLFPEVTYLVVSVDSYDMPT